MTRLVNLSLIYSVSAAAISLGCAAIAQTTAPSAPTPVNAAAPAAEDAKAAAKAAKVAAAAEAKKQRELVRLYGMGPYPAETDAFIADRPEKLKPLYRTLYSGGERNAVLNLQRLGLAAMGEGEWEIASWAFDKALTRVEAIYANNPQANAARSSFHNEANKDFKGEPYERAMAYYYRGLLYMRSGDYDNARASFKSAEFQDTLSESETFQSDFAAMNYLIGWTQKCQGQTSAAAESFAVAAKTQAGLVAPASADNVLFIAELGNAPVKARGGATEELLTFGSGAAYDENAASFSLSGKGIGKQPVTVKPVLASSLNYQATTRGGRAIDGVMKGKATLKQTTSGIGDGLLQAGLAQGDATTMAIGAVFSMFGSVVKTKADIRQWDNLPDQILIGTAQARSSDWNSAVSFWKDDQALEMKPASLMRGDNKSCSFLWTRSRPTDGISEEIVGEDAGVAKAVGRNKAVQLKNVEFRKWLAL